MIYVVICVTSVLVASIAQLLLKKSADENSDASVVGQYMNIKVIFAYGIFFGSTLLTMYSYKGVPLSLGTIISSMEYLFVAVLSWIFLKERITVRQLIGLILIVVGVLRFSF